ncbi:MAG TPA: cytochrome P450 [Acidimicrobiales bacterium]|nr:cytochrome P450 [Acidimicrobiales bacterium]
MPQAIGKNRARLERDLAENRGTDAEELQRVWSEHRRACPFERIGDAEAAEMLGAQRGAYAAAGGGELYIAWGHDDVAQVMRDADHFMKPGPGGPFSSTILAMNGEEHRKYRELVKDAFAPAAVERWEQTLIRPLMHRLVDDFAPAGRADLVRDYTSHFPFHVIRVLLGIPEDQHDEFVGLAFPQESSEHGSGFDASWERKVEAFLDPHLVAARDREVGNDLLTLLVHAELDGRRLTDQELYKFLVLLTPAGADTTFAGASTMYLGLLSHPDQLDMVRRDRRLLARAADEALRWHNSAASSFLRVATADTEVHGCPVAKGTVVAAHVSSHNRDEERYPDADRYDITRAVRPRGIFGYGPHACLGMHIARSEMKVSLDVALDRLTNLRLDPAAPAPYVRSGVGFFPSPAYIHALFDA